MDSQKNLKLQDINIVLADSDHTYRHTIFNMLRSVGLRQIQQVATLDEIRKTLVGPPPDLLISEADLSDGSFCDLVYDLRNGNVGNNPFLVILTLTAEPTKELVRRVIDSGSDDLLTKPMSAAQMKSRIVTLVEQRKPFVVTSDYIGPTRRENGSRGASIPLIKAPNTLREKATGVTADENSQETIEATIKLINRQRLKQYAEQIVYLVQAIVTDLGTGDDNKQTRQHLERLRVVAQDTGRRLIGTDMEHIIKLCAPLIAATERIEKNPETPNERDMELLPPLAAAIKAGFETDHEGTADFARQISSALSN